MAMAAISNFFVAIFTNSAAIWTYPPFDRCSTAYTNSDTFQLVSGGGLTNYPQIGPHGWILWSLLAWLYRISFAFSWGSDVTMYHVLFTFFVWLGFDRSHRPWHVKYLATTTCFWLYCGTVRSTAAFHLEEQIKLFLLAKPSARYQRAAKPVSMLALAVLSAIPDIVVFFLTSDTLASSKDGLNTLRGLLRDFVFSSLLWSFVALPVLFLMFAALGKIYRTVYDKRDPVVPEQPFLIPVLCSSFIALLLFCCGTPVMQSYDREYVSIYNNNKNNTEVIRKADEQINSRKTKLVFNLRYASVAFIVWFAVDLLGYPHFSRTPTHASMPILDPAAPATDQDRYINAQGQKVDMNGWAIVGQGQQGYPIDVNGHRINAQGQRIDAQGIPIPPPLFDIWKLCWFFLIFAASSSVAVFLGKRDIDNGGQVLASFNMSDSLANYWILPLIEKGPGALLLICQCVRLGISDEAVISSLLSGIITIGITVPISLSPLLNKADPIFFVSPMFAGGLMVLFLLLASVHMSRRRYHSLGFGLAIVVILLAVVSQGLPKSEMDMLLDPLNNYSASNTSTSITSWTSPMAPLFPSDSGTDLMIPSANSTDLVLYNASVILMSGYDKQRNFIGMFEDPGIMPEPELLAEYRPLGTYSYAKNWILETVHDSTGRTLGYYMVTEADVTASTLSPEEQNYLDVVASLNSLVGPASSTTQTTHVKSISPSTVGSLFALEYPTPGPDLKDSSAHALIVDPQPTDDTAQSSVN